MRVLGIESSCDETAVALYDDAAATFHERIARQEDIHRPYGGVVPELASRCHIESIAPLVEKTCADAHCATPDIDLIAATAGPGLAGGLLVGLCYAKALAYASDTPFVAVNHIEAHMYAAGANESLEYPFISLVVSGGHTLLAHVTDDTAYTLIGRTRDDAAGEAFDKGAKILGLAQPNGKVLQDVAENGDPLAYDFPRPMRHDPSYDMSFSGIKTALLYFLRDNPNAPQPDVAASYQAAIVDILVEKTLRAAEENAIGTIVLGGGVSANASLRTHLTEEGNARNIRVVLPPFCLCTDNARMIAYRGAMLYRARGADTLDADIFTRFVAPHPCACAG